MSTYRMSMWKGNLNRIPKLLIVTVMFLALRGYHKFQWNSSLREYDGGAYVNFQMNEMACHA